MLLDAGPHMAVCSSQSCCFWLLGQVHFTTDLGRNGHQRETERVPASVGEEAATGRRERQEHSNSSGVKLLMWKIALTVRMLHGS